MKKVLIIISVVIVALAAFGFVRDQLIKEALVLIGSNAAGAPLRIDRLSLSLIGQTAQIRGVRLYNPPGFEQGILVELPRLSVSLDARALLRRKLHLRAAEVQVKELVLIKNRQGKLNVDSLKVAAQSKPQESPPDQKKSGRMDIQIDELTLDIGRVVMKDYSRSAQAVVTVHDINLRRSYKGLTGVEQLIALVMIEPMKSAGITAAAIYGASAVAGMAFLPAAAVFTLAGKDKAEADFRQSIDKVYAESLALLTRIGAVRHEDKASGLIRAKVGGTDIAVKVGLLEGKTHVMVTARRFLVAKPQEANGIIYQLKQQLP